MICTIDEADAGLEPAGLERVKTRHAARAVLFDERGRIALLYVASDNYYKLPGGGVEPGETVEEALRREALEETGCPIEILGEVGTIEEHRDAWALTQYSHCYVARVAGPRAGPSYTEEETEDGFALDWASPVEALLLIRDSLPQTYHGKFIRLRDQTFLIRATELYPDMCTGSER